MDTRRRAPDRGRRGSSPAPRPAAAAEPDAAAESGAEVLELASGMPPGGGPGLRWPVVAGLAALFALVLLTGLPGGDPLGPAAPSPSGGQSFTTGSIPPAIFGTARPGPTDSPWSWTEFELRGYGRGSSVANLWAVDGLLVAELETDEGPDGGPFGPVTSVLLASADGTTWADARVDLPVPGFVIDAGAAWDGALDVIGRVDVDTGDRQRWTTIDGTWVRAPDPVGEAIQGRRLVELAHGETCPAGVGAPDGPGGPDCAEAWLAILGVEGSHDLEELWVSRDGVQWSRAELPGEGPASLAGLAVRREWWYVVASRDAGGGLVETDVVASPDLMTWTGVRVSSEPGGGRDLADGAGGLVLVGAVGTDAARRPYLWRPRTGTSWLGFEAPVEPPRGPTSMDLVAATERGYVAMSATTGDAWLSTDGGRWRNLPAFVSEPGDTVRALVVSGDVVVAGGRSASGRPTLWRTLLSEQLDVP